ncbi:MAG: glutamate 5-kinase [Candidatus Melainabacteria bacterium]|nr:glutamate 5-kinase [Candidatus Melainabacteria bacterium]
MDKTNSKSEKITIKIGTTTLSSLNSEAGINTDIIGKLSDVIAKLKTSGHHIVLVTSGAVALGVKKLNLSKKPTTILGKQATAAVGQAQLMQVYEKCFSKYNIPIAQILLTRDGFAQREIYINARETILELLNMNVLPVINENDAVASEEIRFGDNDMLSAMVSDLISANRLIILTDEEGFYDSNPKTNKTAKLIPIIEKITPEIEKMACGTGSEFSSGGMTSKVQAAKLATSLGIKTHIIHGKQPEKIFDLLENKNIGTTFLPQTNSTEKRKSWIAHTLITNGKIYVDSGAQTAILNNGKSLLPAGIKKISGKFERGSAIEICILNSEKSFAKGITNYSKAELEKIMGLKSTDIEKTLGYTYGETVIHRDDLVILK